MKKYIYLIIAVLTIFLTAGCSESSDAQQEDSSLVSDIEISVSESSSQTSESSSSQSGTSESTSSTATESTPITSSSSSGQSSAVTAPTISSSGFCVDIEGASTAIIRPGVGRYDLSYKYAKDFLSVM